MNEHRFILEPYKNAQSRHTCPGCGKSRQFVRYVDMQQGGYIADDVGKCNREVNCGYHYSPKQFFAHNPYVSQSQNQKLKSRVMPFVKNSKPASSFPFDVFRKTLTAYDENNFVQFLKRLFSPDVVSDLVKRFYIGTSTHWAGANIFWQIDGKGTVRSGKIMLYDVASGKRIKEPFNHINWAHKVLLKAEEAERFNLQQCLFGEHQLADAAKPIAIVESEKTAIIATVYLPDFVWLACGSLTNLTVERCRILARRKVVLFPDLNCLAKWNEKANQLRAALGCCISVSDLLERKASEAEKAQGLDLADFLVRFKPKLNLSQRDVEGLFDEYLERASVLEYDAGFDRTEAEKQAWQEMFGLQSVCPISLSNSDDAIKNCIAAQR